MLLLPLLSVRRFMEVFFFPWLFIIKPYLTYTYLGGMEAVAWSIAVPMVAGWHSTFLVNSAAHVWGRQPYETGETTVPLKGDRAARAADALSGMTGEIGLQV
jgi:fatty-acid desaturase